MHDACASHAAADAPQPAAAAEPGPSGQHTDVDDTCDRDGQGAGPSASGDAAAAGAACNAEELTREFVTGAVAFLRRRFADVRSAEAASLQLRPHLMKVRSCLKRSAHESRQCLVLCKESFPKFLCSAMAK